MRTSPLAVGIVMLALIVDAGRADAWTARVPGTASRADDVRDIARDADGNVVVTDGERVAKYGRGDGALLWRTRLVPQIDAVNSIGPVTVDAAGDVIVAGIVAEFATLPDVLVVKLSGRDGSVLWRHRFDGPGRSADYGIDVTTDGAGDVIVGGVSHLIIEDMLVLKVDGATGVEEWHSVVPGPGVGSDQGLAVAVDALGDVALAGDSTYGDTGRFAVIKVRGSDGRLLWRGAAGGSDATGQAFAVAFDPAGDVVVAGGLVSGTTGFDLAVVKFDGATGVERWLRAVDGSAHESDFGADLVLDAAGNAVAVGRTVNDGTGSDVLVVRVASDGTELWRRDIDGGANAFDGAQAVALVGSRVVVAAAIDGPTYDRTRFAALGLDLESGEDAWRLTRDGDADGRDAATLAIPGIDGEVLVAGRIVSRGSKEDGLLLDLDAASGDARWERNLNATDPGDGEAIGVAVDPTGDAIVGGVTSDPATAADVTVVKLAKASGAEVWRARIDGALHTDDSGGAVVADASGDVFVAAATIDGPGLPPPDPRLPGTAPLVNVSVVRLDGDTGAELWRSEAPGRGFPRADDIVLASGDPVVGGWFGGAQYESIAAVARVDAASGSTRWIATLGISEIGPRNGSPVRVDAGPAGQVAAAVRTRVAKLDAADGTRLWLRSPAAVVIADLAVDAQGDVVVVGDSSGNSAVEKLRGTDGSTRWSVSLGAGRALAVRIGVSGDLFVAGALLQGGDERLAVARIDGDSGAVRWSRIVPGRAPARGLALALDAAGDVLVGGAGSMARRGEDLVALKLRGKDGRLRWRRFVDGGGRGDDRAQAMALDAAGNAVAAGVLSAPDGVGDFAAVRFDGRTGRWR